MTTQQIKREFRSYEEHGQICRLCMSEESLEDVFKDDHLTEWIWELLAIKISGDDCMSQVICTICRIRLTEFHHFRMGCHEVQEVLQALIPDRTDEAQSANIPTQTNPKAANQLQLKGIVDDYSIRREDCFLVFKNEKQLTNHKTIHDHEDQKDIPVKSELVENDELQAQTNEQSISFEKAGIASHILYEEMENKLLGTEDCINVEEVKIETPADDEVDASAESQHNKTKNEEVYRCDICQNVYSNKIQLRDHKNCHKRKLKKQAIKVDEAIPEEKNSEELLAVSDSSTIQKKEDCKDRIHQCDECPKTFMTRRILISHKKSVHGPKLHRCDICDVQFPLPAEMRRHLHTQKHIKKEQEIQKRLNEKTSNQNEKVCKADEKYDNNRTIKNWNLSFDDMLAKYQSYKSKRSNKKDCEKQLKCNECDKTFSNSDRLRKHKQYHEQKKVFCHVCEKPCHNGYKLKNHLATHASPVERQQARAVRDIENAPRPHKCDICHKAFMEKSTLQQHNKIVHGPKKFECEICGYKCSYNGILIRHLQKHTLCGHTKEDFRALKKLSQQNDESTNQNDEEMSDRSSVPSDNEANEKDKAHKDPSKSDVNSSELASAQPFQCDVCHEAFETKVLLYRHKRYLHNPKRFKCSICSERFAYRQQRNMHMKTHKPKSTATKDFECPECHKIWPSWRSLYFHVKNGHVRKKTLPKEHTVDCPKCDKMFSTARQRDLHMRRVHTEHKCQICNKKFSKRVQLSQHMNNQHGKKSASSDSEDTIDESDLEDSVQNSNEESTIPLEANATK